MRFSVAKDLITPCFNMKLSCTGLFDQDFEYIHDDIFVRCLVIDDGTNKTLLMSLDLLFNSRAFNEAITIYAQETYGFSASAVVVASTHSHTTPVSKGYSPDGDCNDNYEAFLLERAKRCIDRAMSSMFEGTLEYNSFDEFFNISRRGIVNGQQTIHPNPVKERDTEIAILIIRDLFGNLKSIVMNYACHPVFYPALRSISGEFPARLTQLIDSKYYGCTSLFFQSACGDVRPAFTVVDDKFATRLSFREIDNFAQNLCDAVCDHVKSNLPKYKDISVLADKFTIDLPINPRTLDELIDETNRLERGGYSPTVAKAKKIINGDYDNLPKSMALVCQTIRLSDDLYLATMGGEPCYGVKKIVKSAFPKKNIIFIGYTDSCAYIVDDQMLQEGGYEPSSYLEYGMQGPFQLGLDKRYFNGFKDSYKRLQ